MYFFDNELDYDNSNPRIRANWVNSNSNRDTFYTGEGIVLDDIFFEKSTMHDSTHQYVETNAMNADESLQEIVTLSNNIIANGKYLFIRFESYRNREVTEEDLITAIRALLQKHKHVSSQLHSLGFPDAKHRRAIDLLIDVDGAINDAFLFYTNETYLERDSQNRILCMEAASCRYNRAVKCFLEEIGNLEYDAQD